MTSPFRRGVEVGGGRVLAAGGVCRCVRVGMRVCADGGFLCACGHASVCGWQIFEMVLHYRFYLVYICVTYKTTLSILSTCRPKLQGVHQFSILSI